TEWNIFTGAFPPLSEQQWVTEFDKYKQTPQYHLLNAGFGLSDFKFIFFWEWFHRLWARLVGLVFVAGFIYLVARKEMKKDMVKPMLILFLLGALQGAIGWIMVASGLTGDAIYVKPAKLALHFVFALGLICYTFWFYLELTVPRRNIIRERGITLFTISILVILFFQLVYGALMAGYKAANIAPTWPRINGDWIPPLALKKDFFLLNLVDDKIMVQFIHRGLAYLLLVLTLVWTVKANKVSAVSKYWQKSRWLPVILIAVQVILGITALLLSPGIVANHWIAFDWVALFHQLTGMLFLLTMVFMLFLVRPVESNNQ
ncbi:MAG TPA: COX15/CtaA family protein, partial [Puia sp.]|nr:COX15/CtaA family protein [Puia sp.]